MEEKNNLEERIAWLIRLRWVAVTGVIFAVLFSRYGLRFYLPLHHLCALTVFLALYNLIFYLYKFSSHANRIANLQISLDLLTLTGLLHFSGGIENPFIFYFVFHMIIASILLSRRASFLQATFAAALFTGMCILEYSGIIPHYCLKGFVPFTLHHSLLYIAGVYFVFVTTIYIAVYMATSISAKLREREAGLAEANRLLNEKDRIKSEYVLRVSHDIREDLSAIQSCIEPVTEGITGKLNEGQMNLLERARERTWRLLAFVRELLEITSIKLGRQLKTEIFPISELIGTISERTRAKAMDKNITFEVSVAPSVNKIKGVRVYIEEAVLNLLTNSIKYTPPGGAVHLNARNSNDEIVIEIKDTGIGIPKESMPHIFEEFYRAENAKHIDNKGTGLGLAIVKEIVDMHRGEIKVTSEEGRGTTFELKLPKGI